MLSQKNNFIVPLTLLLLLPAILFASTYNTIVIDGSNNGWATDESFDDISHDGDSNPRFAYFTWDADYIYIGIEDIHASYNNMATFVYFDTDPSGSNGDTNAYAWGEFINVGFKADYVVVWKNNYNDDYIEVREYNNSASNWDFLTSNTATFITNDLDTLVKFAVYQDSNYREVKIKRSLIGDPQAVKTCMFTEEQWTGSGYYRYMTWPSEGWTDASRASGQTIPHYYGFLLEEHVSLDSLPYYDAAFTTWTGNSNNNWSDAGNWDNNIPYDTTLVIIPSGATVYVDASAQSVFDLALKSGASVTVDENNSLTVYGGFFNHAGASGMVVKSSATGNGSLIVKGYAGDSVTAQCYVTASRWHSFTTPVNGQTTSDLFLNHSPEVWLLEYHEAIDDYEYISSLTQNLGDMQGWMLWLGGTSDHTYNFEGPLRSGTIGTDNNMVRSAAGNYGYNFVGNPFPSAINWESAAGWTKTNLAGAIYIYDGTHQRWATYATGDSTNGGSRFIAMNQGFFVQVADGGGAYPQYGTLKMTNEVCVHNNVAFFNAGQKQPSGNVLRIQVQLDSLTDETVIRIRHDATAGFDPLLDAHKLSGFDDAAPGIFSSDNGGMSINSLPPGTESVPIDFSGPNTSQMTVSLTQCDNFNHVFLTDNVEQVTVDLKEEPYTFIYRNYIHNRFYIHFTMTGTGQTEDLNGIEIFAANHRINIVNPTDERIEIEVYNLLGQQIRHLHSDKHLTQITVEKNRYYIVKTNNGKKRTIKKVFIN